jgi:lipoprotein-anchoring transpeptidase ErfK/SrfK
MAVSPSDYQVGGKEFIPDAEYAQQLCHNPLFKCRPVKNSETWRELFPNDQQRDLVERINRTNVPLQYRTEIILPRDISKLNYEKLAPFSLHRDTDGKRLLYIDLDKFAFAAYDKEGKRVLWGPASGGKPWCDDTQESCLSATGTYHVFRIKGEDCESGTYPLESKGGASMPYCMYYYKGFAIHGSTLSGFVNRSRGCIRLFDEDAKWLNQHFVQLGTEVIVKQ